MMRHEYREPPCRYHCMHCRFDCVYYDGGVEIAQPTRRDHQMVKLWKYSSFCPQ